MSSTLNRRRFLGAAGGTAAAATLLGTNGPAANAATGSVGSEPGSQPEVRGKTLIPQNRRGIILYTVRDAVGRDPLASDAPSGFLELFQYLSAVGYEQIEFAGYNQHANPAGGANPGTADPAAYLAYAQTLRGFLDDNGLTADGNHGFIPATWPPNMTPEDADRFDLELEFASILGMPHMGTGGDPTGSAYKEDWDVAAEKWNELGEIARSYDIKLYTHNHDSAYDFLLDSGPADDQGRPTRSSGIRRLEYFLDQTDNRFAWLQMDIYWAHVAQHRFQTYTNPDGEAATLVVVPGLWGHARRMREGFYDQPDHDDRGETDR